MRESRFAVKVDLPEDPRYVVIHEVFVVSRKTTHAFLDDLMDALSAVARTHHVAILGGETSLRDDPPDFMKGHPLGTSE